MREVPTNSQKHKSGYFFQRRPGGCTQMVPCEPAPFSLSLTTEFAIKSVTVVSSTKKLPTGTLV